MLVRLIITVYCMVMQLSLKNMSETAHISKKKKNLDFFPSKSHPYGTLTTLPTTRVWNQSMIFHPFPFRKTIDWPHVNIETWFFRNSRIFYYTICNGIAIWLVIINQCTYIQLIFVKIQCKICVNIYWFVIFLKMDVPILNREGEVFKFGQLEIYEI